jgi:hypothetical protein
MERPLEIVENGEERMMLERPFWRNGSQKMKLPLEIAKGVFVLVDKVDEVGLDRIILFFGCLVERPASSSTNIRLRC